MPNQFDDLALAGLSKNGTVTTADIRRIEEMCYEQLRQGDLYAVRNDAKLRAVYSSGSYDEFKDIVDAAHLRPLDKLDKRTTATKSRLWNSSVREPSSSS